MNTEVFLASQSKKQLIQMLLQIEAFRRQKIIPLDVIDLAVTEQAIISIRQELSLRGVVLGEVIAGGDWCGV